MKSRAVAFALSAGAVVFILALAATSHGRVDAQSAAIALIPAVICAAMSWACVERALAGVASAVDVAIARLSRAANGDLDEDIPAEIARTLPELAVAMDGLFRQLGENLESAQRLAMFDPVTALPNRINFRRSCERALAGLAPGSVAALLFIDLDRFKAVNDSLGHAIGDSLLGMVANRLRAVAARAGRGSHAIVGRLAGDEFTIFLPDIGSTAEAARIGRAVLFALSEPFEIAGQEIEIGASVGVALRPRHGTSLTELMRAADAAMYQAKGHGRGRVEQFSEALASQLADRAQLEIDLRSAVERDQFALVYQPQVRLTDGAIVAAEALLRWNHPGDGLRLPGSFIERAEETGLIVEIGQWVIDTVAMTIARWSRMGIEQRLAINVSRRQLDHASFFRGLRQAMHAAGAPARLLELEITETLAMHCSDDVLAAIGELRADGALVAIDDFGTGYSNLARLKVLPIDRIKLDRSIVEHIVDHAEARAVAQAVIGLIHGLGCQAVAEAVESDAQMNLLRVLGCDVVQGYAVAPPMAEAAFVDWARAGDRAISVG
ncbi:diguanylate cyclase (GGDEF)-like protein [Hephaestia caeni]|uniref:Diguanylate cyclase (GGDEF)-like protein n=1 Tax=Hephaestia caeni TaxID=645617 RepID=A0A397NK60_9SPHN|nr:EAL domain-containing protein [Hephaestia caeni]RIA36738.1 diguanylate cyclase (GGDEF)-like protein [Hephaestia caeni]